MKARYGIVSMDWSDGMKQIGKYLEAHEMPNPGKLTRKFEIINTSGQGLGSIRNIIGDFVRAPKPLISIPLSSNLSTNLAILCAPVVPPPSDIPMLFCSPRCDINLVPSSKT